VTCYDFYQKKNYMILGDEFGNISVWNCSALMNELDIIHGETDEFNEKLSDDEIIRRWKK